MNGRIVGTVFALCTWVQTGLLARTRVLYDDDGPAPSVFMERVHYQRELSSLMIVSNL